MSRGRRPAVAILGAGRLARAFLPALMAAGYPLAGIASRTPGSARKLVRGIRGARVAASPEAAVERAALVLLAVPDREIAPLARRLARRMPSGWRLRTVLHHAGALGPSPLTPLSRLGAAVGVMHPMQVLGRSRAAGAALPGSRARIEGDPRAARIARRLALDLGLVPVRFARPLGPKGRAAWHAAASLASNDLVALVSLAVETLGAVGLREPEALKALLPIARGTLDQLAAGGIEGALTGPVARGDVATLISQLVALRGACPEAAEAHRVLALRLLGIAEARGGLAGSPRSRLRGALEAPRRGRRRRAGV